MYKRCLTWIAFVTAVAAAGSVRGAEPKLFALFVVDTGAKDVSHNLMSNLSGLVNEFNKHIIHEYLDMDIVEAQIGPGGLSEPSVTRDNVLRHVREGLGRAGPDDAVFVYIASHGGFDKTPGKGAFLRFAAHPGSPLFRHELLAEVDKLDVRLKVVVTESCNTFQRVFQGAFAGAPGEFPRPPYSPLFRSLFVESGGRLILASSAPGEYSMIPPPADWNGNDPRRPTLFTGCLLEEFHNPERAATWEEVVGGAKAEVDRRFRLMFPDGYVDPEMPFAPPQKTQTVTVDGGRFPERTPRPGGPARDLTRRLGFDMIYPNGILYGAMVREVEPDGVAVRAGRLEPGDHITKVNGIFTISRADPVKVVSSADALIDALGRAGPGGRVYIEGISARTGRPFAPFFAVLPPAGPLAGRLGVTVIDQPATWQSLWIGALRPRSFAASLGLGRGDVITELNGQPL